MGRTAVSVEGALLPRELLDRVDNADPKLPGMKVVDFDLAPGERVRDAITRSWQRLNALWIGFRQAEESLPLNEIGTSLTRERLLLPLLDELGFEGLPLVQSLTIKDEPSDSLAGKDYAVSHEWAGCVPVHLMGWRVDVDRRSPRVPGASKASPHGLVQEFLNRSDDHLWGIVSNGRVLRLLRDNASFTRQAFVEFDLSVIFDGDLFADFALLWLCCHRTRFEADQPQQCLLEQWSHEAAFVGARARDKLRDGVESAIVALGCGVLEHRTNQALRARLRSKELAPELLQRQLLRVVYRLLFLLVAEARGLLHSVDANSESRHRYEHHYSAARLRRFAERRRGGDHCDLWEGLAVTMAAVEIGDTEAQQNARSALGLTSLGSFLWSSAHVPDLTGTRISNARLLETIRNLALVRDDEARLWRRVDYRNLGTEELGSIYESLLELHPDADPDARTFDLKRTAGSERKTTGSYYTPPALISRLLDDVLDPVIDEAAAQSDPEQALLTLKVLDPACGSGHFLIAAAHRIAARLARVREGGTEPSAYNLRIALREVVGHCLYGIDVNPMAVELCKVSLWLEANIPGRPLGFLEHRIVCGNSLLGTTPRLLSTGVPDAAFKVSPGDDKKHVSTLRKRNTAERKARAQLLFELDYSLAADSVKLATALQRIDEAPEHTAEQVASKEVEYAEVRGEGFAQKEKLIADTWCAAFVAPKTSDAPAITDRVLGEVETLTSEQILAMSHSDSPLGGSLLDQGLIETIQALAEVHPFMHPHLNFPEVFTGDVANPETGWRGGFDVIVGNPPFLNQLDTATTQSKRLAEFLKERYPGVAGGYANTASLFVELCSQLVRPDGGRVGLVQPASVLAAADAKGMRESVTRRGRLEALWVAREKMFNANVLTCALALRNGESGKTQQLRRFQGADFAELTPLELNSEDVSGMETWAPLIADGFGIPRVDLDQSRMLGEVLEATGDFRDQYYGLVPFVAEADGRVPDGIRFAALVTTGLIEPAELLWGERPTKFNKVSYQAPVVDLERLRAESDLGDWAANRLVPKLLLATQTRVIEVVVDEAGVLLPSVPVITITTDGISLWHAAAALMSPPITAWAAARYMGAAMSIDALKLSASQVQNLPLPARSVTWDTAAAMVREAGRESSSQQRTQHLQEAGALMSDAYGVSDADHLMSWWRGRLGRRSKERSS